MYKSLKDLVRRILASCAAVFVFAAAVFPFASVKAQAKGSGFTMEFTYKLPDGQETVWQASARKENDDLINFANFTDGQCGASRFIKAAIYEAGEISVSSDEDGCHFSIPAVSIDMDTGDSEISNHYVINMESMSFTGPEFTYLDEDASESGRRFWYGDFRLDHPVTFTETYEIYYHEEREWQNTYHYEYTLEKCRILTCFAADKEGNPIVAEDSAIHATENIYHKGNCHWWDEDDWVDEVFDDGFYNEDEPYFTGDSGPLYIRGFSGGVSGDSDKADQVVTKDAEKEAGEDGGEEIGKDIVLGKKGTDEDGKPSLPAAVATGAGGTAAAIGAAAASAKRKKEKTLQEIYDEDTRDYSVFRMIVYKDFGDTIKKGSQGVYVSARITEYRPISGQTIPRDDLTGMIVCHSADHHLTVEDRGIGVSDFAWKNAFVTVPIESPFDEGQVSFSFTGPGGTFLRNVVFKLAGPPKLYFQEDADNGEWVLNETGEAQMITGDARTYRVRFYIRDALEKPAFRYTGGSADYSVTFEEDTQFENTYFAVIQNESAAPEEESVFNEVKESRFTIYALFSDKTEIFGDVFVSICPEGLSVKVKDAEIKGGRIIVECALKEAFYGDDADPTKFFVNPYFEVMLAVSTDEGAKVMKPSRSMLRIGELEAENEGTKNLLLKFEYEIEWLSGDEGNFWFKQKNALYEGKHPYDVLLPLSCSAEGRDYEAKIPLCLQGEGLEPMSEREVELHNLLRAMRLYIEDDAERAEWFYFFKERMTDTKVSAKTYRLMRWQIYSIWQANAEAETERWIAWGNTFESWTTAAEWTKWIAVRCFAMVAKKYAAVNYGPLGESLADAFVQPAAEFVLDCVEELTDATLNGRDFDIEKTKYWVRLSEGGDNLAWSFTSDAVLDLYKAPADGAAALSMKQRITRTCTYIGIYFGYTVLRNFLTKMRETGEADLPGAIWDSFKDLTTNVIKTTVGKLFGHWMEKCPNFCRGVAQYTGETIQKAFGEQAVDMVGDIVITSDFAGKWVEELVGEGVGKVFEAVEEWAPQSWAAGKLNTVTFSTTSLQGVSGAYVAFELYHPAKGVPIYCEIDLLRGLSAAASGPLAPFTLLCQYLLGAITGAPAPVVFSAEKPDITNDDVYNFEKLHQKTEQDMAEWIFDKTGLSDTTTYVNQKVSNVGNAVYDGIDSAVDKTDLGSAGDKTREVIGNAMQGGVELTREGMEPAVNALADAKIEAESRRI